jgi:hypothetical protein
MLLGRIMLCHPMVTHKKRKPQVSLQHKQF